MTRHRTKQTAAVGRIGDMPRLLGGAPCLDFANTIEAPRSSHPVDFLQDYTDVARWCGHVDLLDDEAVRGLLSAARGAPGDATRLFEQALALRGAVHRTFSRVSAAAAPPAADLALIQREYVSALAEARLASVGPALGWSWDHRRGDLRRPLWLVAESAVRLLTSGDLTRIRECPGADDCGWLFYDSSPAGRRRWCSMEGCGSRVKMRRQYARQKQA